MPKEKVAEAFVVGICCEYCDKFNTGSCPVVTADPWSRWKDYCGEFRKKGKTILQVIKEEGMNNLG